VFQKSDANIQIIITTAYLIRIKYPLSGFNYHLSDAKVENFNEIHCTVSEQQPFKKIELKNRSFQYGKVSLEVRTQKNISYSLCSKWPPFARTHARSRTRHCRTAQSM